ncbi:hypothetical protein KBB27_02680 [Patescibacteria group bacterium]|nr:hypothetical protein [Patescibacteria group bacterium]
MEQKLETENQKKSYNPVLCALAHPLFFGSAYLYLRLYKRFFTSFALFVFVGFTIPSSIPLDLMIVAAMVDTYQQVTGINEGTIKQEPYSRAKNTVGILVIVFTIFIAFLVEVILPILSW